MRRLLATLLLVAFVGIPTALVGLAVWELALRSDPGVFAHNLDFAGMYENDGDGSVRTVPGFETRVANEGRWLRVKLNRLGLRSPEVPPVKGPREKRVLALGDSQVFGQGVEGEETFPNVLAQRLGRSLGAPVLGGNAGMPGNGIADQRRDLLRYKSTFEPDVVLACVHLGTDFQDDVSGPKEVVAGFAMNTEAARFTKNSLRARLALRSRAWFELEWWITTTLGPLAMGAPVQNEQEQARTEGFPPPAQRGEALFLDARSETPQMRAILDRTLDNLRRLRDEVRPAGFVVVLLPSWVTVWPDAWEAQLRAMGLDPAAHERGLASRRICERVEKELQASCFDGTAALLAHPKVLSLYLAQDRHFNAAGHAWLAEQLEPRTLDALARK